MTPLLPPSTPRALALLVAASFAGSALANTGRVEFVSGAVTLRNAQGERPLSRGIELSNGDTVVTGDRGRAQIRFSDGAFVSLQPDTQFSIEQYRFNGTTDGSESGVFGLVAGAMRTVTGLVGRVNRDRYQIKTPNATVGIRGTGGIVAFRNGATSIVGTSGVWVLTNPAGSINVPAGRAAIAGPDTSKPPQESSDAPQTPPAPATGQQQGQESKEPPISPSENRNSTGQSTTVASNPTKEIALAVSIMGTPGSTSVFATTSTAEGPVTGTFNASSQLTGYVSKNIASNYSTTVGITGTHAEGGSSEVGSWGRWVNATWTSTTVYNGTTTTSTHKVGPNGGIHYVVGTPPTAMPTSGSFTYNMIGATSPTFKLENFAPGVVNSASLTGSFTPTGGSIAVNMALTAASTNYTVATSPTSFTGTTFYVNGNYTSGGTCSGGCSTTVNGGFAGAGASHAGVGYSITLSGGNEVGGVVAFKKQ